MQKTTQPIIRAIALICTASALTFAARVRAETPARKPNIIVVFTDDHGFADLSCQNILKDIQTPHLDQLARDGVRMTSGYVTAPQCIPSRAGLLTGRYQQRFGVEHNATIPLPLDEITIAQRLQKAGYVTGMVGKWHLDPIRAQTEWLKENALGPSDAIPEKLRKPYLPTERGFTESFCGELQRYWATYDLTGKSLKPGGEVRTEKGFRVDIQTDAAVTFINRHHEQPFFLYVAYFAPHVPLEATEKYLKRFPGEMPERRRYALAMISAMDDGVGRIRETLRQHGLEKDTLIFFISDNGAPLKTGMPDTKPITENGWDGSRNDPYVGEKGMLSEGGIRVPYVVAWPGTLPAGKTYAKLVSTLDVAATAMAVAGQKPVPELDGVNLIPYLTGAKDGEPHAALYWRFWTQSAIRKGQWKYLQAGGEKRYLFDLSSSQPEKENVIEQHPEIAQSLSAELAKWAADLKTPGVPTGKLKPGEEQWFEYYFEK
jgi:arylsulfatase A-like enzyme